MKLDVKINIGNLAGDITAEASKVVRKATLLIEQKAKIAIQTGPKTGREYRRRGGRIHRASARGEAPATDTAFLVGSISSDFPSATTGVVTVAAHYAEILEEALDRPFVRPAIEDTLKDLEEDNVIGGLQGLGF
jgi:hypothetical protein